MIKKFLSLVMLCIAITSQAQHPKITLGKPYLVVDAPAKYYFSKGSEMLTVKVIKKAVYLQKLNSNSLTFEKIKLYDDFPKGFMVEFVTPFQDRYYLFYSVWDGSSEQLFAREIDFDACSFNGSGKKIISVDHKISAADKYDFYFSANASNMAIQYRLKPDVKNDSKSYDNIGLHIFDGNLTELWGKVIKMPYTEKKMNNLDYSVDSKGNAYIVTSVFDDETTDDKKRGSKAPNYHVEILKIEAQTGVVIPTKVNLEGNFIQTLIITENPKGYMNCSGFYNIGKNASNADGIILFKLGGDNTPYDFKTYEIPVEVLNQFVSSRAKQKIETKDEKDQAEFENLKLRNFFTQEDGSIILLGEQTYSVTRSYYNPLTRTFTTYTIYYYNDMLATKIDPEGRLAWMQKLPKRQESQSGGGMGMMFGGFGGSRSRIGGMSFYYFKGSNKHYLLYLDNEKNINLPVTSVPAYHVDGQGGFLTAYSVDDNTGAVEKISILNTREVDGVQLYQFTPRRIKETSENTFVFEAYIKDKSDLLVKVEMP